MADSDDDDFQNPKQAISRTQNLLLSSFQKPKKNPISKPLRPANVNRSTKKLKRTLAGGKENSQAPITQKDSLVDLRVDGENGSRSEVAGFSTSFKSRLLESSTSCSSVIEHRGLGESCTTSKTHVVDSVLSTLVRSSLPESGMSGNPEVENGFLDGSDEIMRPSVSDFSVSSDCDAKKGFGLKSGYLMNSIESKLMESKMNCGSGIGECGLDEDVFGDFEPGTQLNELMNLCCEMGEEENPNGVIFNARGDLVDVMSGSVECPLCRTDISDLSEELRQVHTNECLDKDDASKLITQSDDVKPDLPQKKKIVVSPVLEWLSNLGLSRYEEAFIREEIDWDTLKWLTEEDLISIGVTALGPRKKMVHALNELKRNIHENEVPTDTADRIKKAAVPGNKLITEFFQGSSSVDRKRDVGSTTHCRAERSNTNLRCRSAAKRSRILSGSLRDIPPWCCIPGTPFRVDAFRYLRADCSHWFLTHFHMDHYQGLTRGFCHGKIYCSSITAHLVNMKIGVPWDRLHVLPLNERIRIADIDVTCLDANHCPGSIIIIFEPPNSKAVLHTGDFRFSDEMASMSALQSCRIHTLILDTTYCNPQYDFPKQEAVIQFVIEAIQAESFNPRTLFLIGSYTIGKERLFMEVARCLRKKVYVGAAKLRLLENLELPKEDMQWFTCNEQESHIHVVPMWTIASFKRMKHLADRYSSRFNLIVAFSPTGWTFGKGKKKSPGRRWQQGTIIRYEVPYSEHCSFTELKEFVHFVSPETIVPSVNNDSPESSDAMIALLTSES